MTKWDWTKTVYVRKREPGAVWERIQNGAPVGDLANVPEPWSDVISFTHRAPQGYMVLQARVVLAPRSEIRSFVPPTPIIQDTRHRGHQNSRRVHSITNCSLGV